MEFNRRNFVKNASIMAFGAALPLEAIAEMRRRISPNDKIQVGLIGANGMGAESGCPPPGRPSLPLLRSSPRHWCVRGCRRYRNIAVPYAPCHALVSRELLCRGAALMSRLHRGIAGETAWRMKRTRAPCRRSRFRLAGLSRDWLAVWCWELCCRAGPGLCLFWR